MGGLQVDFSRIYQIFPLNNQINFTTNEHPL